MNIKQLREDTLGTKYHIHLNNAGASLVTRQVKHAVTNYLDQEEMHGGYETAERFMEDLLATYSCVGKLINADKHDIALLENATIAWNQAFWSIPFQQGDVVLTTNQEYASNFINYLIAKEKFKIKIKIIPQTNTGEVDLNKLRELLKERAKLVSITHMPTNGGLVQPVEEIGKILNDHDAIYLIDACQSAGQYPLDIKKIQCDFLSATGRKYLRAPRGTGFLYASKAMREEYKPFYLDLHSATWTEETDYLLEPTSKRYETWESNLANRMGFKMAVEYALDLVLENIWKRILSLSSILRGKLEDVPGIKVLDTGNVCSGIVTFAKDGIGAEKIKQHLTGQNINVSVTYYENTLLDMKKRHLTEMVRASIHYYNTEDEIDKCISALQALK